MIIYCDGSHSDYSDWKAWTLRFDLVVREFRWSPQDGIGSPCDYITWIFVIWNVSLIFIMRNNNDSYEIILNPSVLRKKEHVKTMVSCRLSLQTIDLRMKKVRLWSTFSRLWSGRWSPRSGGNWRTCGGDTRCSAPRRRAWDDELSNMGKPWKFIFIIFWNMFHGKMMMMMMMMTRMMIPHTVQWETQWFIIIFPNKNNEHGKWVRMIFLANNDKPFGFWGPHLQTNPLSKPVGGGFCCFCGGGEGGK